jgi:SAM-dependent methyltransferase
VTTELRYESSLDPAAQARHRRLAELLEVAPGDRVVDLGCGVGVTLEILLAGQRGGLVVGVDISEDAVQVAAQLPARHPAGRLGLLRADLTGPLPLADGSVDRALCHNVLEALPEPQRFLREVHRVLRPGGWLLLTHPDYDTLSFSSSDRELTRRLVQTYTDTQQPWMGAVDGTIGRKLPGIVGRSPLRIVAEDAWVVAGRRFEPRYLGWEFAHDVVEVCGMTGRFRDDELTAWLATLQEAADDGVFLFTVNDYAVLCQRTHEPLSSGGQRQIPGQVDLDGGAAAGPGR